MQSALFISCLWEHCLIFWAIGFYSTNAGSIIHILFLMAVIALAAGLTKDESLLKKLKIKRE
jgi:hypothetical protein